MRIETQLEKNRKLPYHEDYNDFIESVDFWWRSYELKKRYLWGKDAVGGDILWRHCREDEEKYKQRLYRTKPRPYMPQIINQFNSIVFGSEIERVGVPEIILDDADGHGTSLSELIKEACLKAQVKKSHILIPSIEGPETTMSVAQAASAGVRYVIKSYDIETLINHNEDEVLFRTSPSTAKYFNSEYYIDIELDSKESSAWIKAVSEPIPHNWPSTPVVLLSPKLWPESQAAKLADICQTIFNLQSQEMYEVSNKTFTHTVIGGAFEGDIDDVSIGNGEATILQTMEGSSPTIQHIGGAAVDQADSIRTSIATETDALYKTAGLAQVQSSDAIDTQSGISKALANEQTMMVAQSIADACEEAENRLWFLFEFNAETTYTIIGETNEMETDNTEEIPANNEQDNTDISTDEESESVD